MTTIPANILCAAEFLEGTVFNGWVVTKKVPKDKNSTGGHFSIPYFVEKREGNKTKYAFLKALNFNQIAASSDFSKAVEQHTAAFNFEKDTLSLCRNKGLTRIVSLLSKKRRARSAAPYQRFVHGCELLAV